MSNCGRITRCHAASLSFKKHRRKVFSTSPILKLLKYPVSFLASLLFLLSVVASVQIYVWNLIAQRLHLEEHGRHVALPPVMHTHSSRILASYSLIHLCNDTFTSNSEPILFQHLLQLSLSKFCCDKLDNIYFCSGLHNMETNPLPQRCSNGSCQCHVTRTARQFT